MGYEIKLFIGEEGITGEEWQTDEDGKLTLDENGHIIPTGKTATYFQVWAMIDICKAGYDSNIHKIPHGNKDDSHSWYLYGLDGNIQFKKDPYGERIGPPIPIDVFIKALSKDVKADDYRRIKWALDLMKSIKKNQGENAKVIWWGY